MCCFLVPLAEAAAASIVRKSVGGKSTFTGRHIASLEKMLWGGSVMLIVDHIINGELTWRFPFFTALGAEGGTEVFWHELLTVGVPMAAVLTLVWLVYGLLKDAAAVRREAN